MNSLNDLNRAVRQAKAQGNISLRLNASSLQLYSGEPLQFNVTLKGQHSATIKFEERTSGKFTVAVAPEDGASIDYTKAKVFTMDEPIEHLTTAFPQSEDMRRFVNSLIYAE